MNSNLISLWRSDVVVRFFISRVAPPKDCGYRLAVLSAGMTPPARIQAKRRLRRAAQA